MARIHEPAITLGAAMLLLACAGKQPANLGFSAGALAACPASPNCVSSDASDADHRVEAFELSVPPKEAWGVVQEEIAKMPRTTVIEVTPNYLHAESTSAVFRFVDDLELELRSQDGTIAVRSASRVGHSDMGVNRRRVDRLRDALEARGVVRANPEPAG